MRYILGPFSFQYLLRNLKDLKDLNILSLLAMLFSFQHVWKTYSIEPEGRTNVSVTVLSLQGSKFR
jgi:hypothetical protein